MLILVLQFQCPAVNYFSWWQLLLRYILKLNFWALQSINTTLKIKWDFHACKFHVTFDPTPLYIFALHFPAPFLNNKAQRNSFFHLESLNMFFLVCPYFSLTLTWRTFELILLGLFCSYPGWLVVLEFANLSSRLVTSINIGSVGIGLFSSFFCVWHVNLRSSSLTSVHSSVASSHLTP